VAVTVSEPSVPITVDWAAEAIPVVTVPVDCPGAVASIGVGDGAGAEVLLVGDAWDTSLTARLATTVSVGVGGALGVWMSVTPCKLVGVGARAVGDASDLGFSEAVEVEKEVDGFEVVGVSSGGAT
jgi:hypothetical protein